MINYDLREFAEGWEFKARLIKPVKMKYTNTLVTCIYLSSCIDNEGNSQKIEYIFVVTISIITKIDVGLNLGRQFLMEHSGELCGKK